MLVDAGASLSDVIDGGSVLQHTLKRRQFELFDNMLNQADDFSLTRRNSMNCSLLHTAIMTAPVTVVQRLLSLKLFDLNDS